eukprot:CAMPEP_0197855716 /NCGR_PEP_ID=MMETSP1438-20131217/27121_1 /TAXON_ID=1461541 /ORGANISM="Pterosperma sp., Strain CCMP1384" /LENGTH=252 /DNA_ID=CAMNT_0043470917 /DNA_START=317 /DNA_END=1075 /DNA_ORIENTATION=-
MAFEANRAAASQVLNRDFDIFPRQSIYTGQFRSYLQPKSRPPTVGGHDIMNPSIDPAHAGEVLEWGMKLGNVDKLDVASGYTEEQEKALAVAAKAFAEGVKFKRFGRHDNTEITTDIRRKAFAVIEMSGRQWKVTPDDLVYLDKCSERIEGMWTPLDVHDKVVFPYVMLLGSTEQSVIGRPYIKGACVVGVVEEQKRDGKILLFKKKRRKGYRKMRGLRTQLTAVRITEIIGLDIPDDTVSKPGISEEVFEG